MMTPIKTRFLTSLQFQMEVLLFLMFCWSYLGQCDAVNFLKWASIKLLFQWKYNHTQNDNDCNQCRNYKSFKLER